MCGPDGPVEKYLAHSARPELGIPAQGYFRHAGNVVRFCESELSSITVDKRIQPLYDFLKRCLLIAASFHDLGKLGDENQSVLRGDKKARNLPINHCDAGVAYMMRNRALLSALLIYSHHIGLPNIADEKMRINSPCGDLRFRDNDETVQRDSSQNLETYLARHCESFGSKLAAIEKISSGGQLKYPVGARVLLSCLADADHTDTAIHYRNFHEEEMPLLQAEKRLAALDNYVAGLASSDNSVKMSKRNIARSEMYEKCRCGSTKNWLYYCDSPVGTGKTTAIMAALLNAAHAKNLRRIFIVLPFTNILKQSVDVYRKALRLQDESDSDMERVVAAIHHKAEYEDENSRQLSALWRSPIIVTTAVQFFETMAAASPSGLRKLHALPNSAVFIDEAHTALPTSLWPLAWRWINDYAEMWRCHFILASGSLKKFWELEEFKIRNKDDNSIPSLLPREFSDALNKMETRRVPIKRKPEKMDETKLCEWLLTLKGPRLVVLNTVQSAAVIANTLADICGREHVEHISTAIAPKDRELIVENIKRRLSDKKDEDWTLVATSCVEAGVDFSFRNGVREAAGLVNLLQLAGRIRRNEEDCYNDSVVWSIELDFSGMLKRHPSFEISSKVLLDLFAENPALINDGTDISDLCTRALRRELNECGMTEGSSIMEDEMACSYASVEKKFKVIDSQTVTVIIDTCIKERLESYETISWRELQDHSVQIYVHTARNLKVEPVRGHPDIYFWPYSYNKFIGYMAGVLENYELNSRGFGFL